MGLLERLFGNKKDGPAEQEPENSHFREAEAAPEPSSKNMPRRELVHVVLRDTMRKHGIPSDWIECHMLSVVSGRRGSGLHVQLVVRQGDDRLLTYVHAFQESFVQELERFDPKTTDWLFSLSWQFEGRSTVKAMPDPSTWGAAAKPAAGAAPEPQDAGLQEDLKALFAIRDAVLKQRSSESGAYPEFEPTRPGFGEDEQPRGKPRR